MSWQESEVPQCADQTSEVVDLVIRQRSKDLGTFTVRRSLPVRERRMVGPFIFFDHMGPAEMPPGVGIEVRPHPHIGIATITYLFEGEIFHRDSLGYAQAIQPGAVNLMTAGKGIVHSERAGSDLDIASRLHGIQSWIALPTDQEECEPDFVHFPADSLPAFSVGNVAISLIMGSAYGHTSPVTTYSPTLYMECRMPADSKITLPETATELAFYVVTGEVSVGKECYSEGEMIVAADNAVISIHANSDSHVMVIGGDPVGERHIWWNLVSSSEERIEQAKKDWQEGRFESVPGDDEYIPLPAG